MKNIRKKQIKKLFNNFINILYNGIWFSGIIRYGKYKKWYSNGQLKIEINYNENGKKIGKYKELFKNGQLKIDANYNENGKTIGIYKEWWENGSLEEISNYNEKGELDGICKKWDYNGNLVFEIKFKNNELVSINYVDLNYSKIWFNYYDQIQDDYISFYDKIKEMYNEKHKKKTN